MPGIFGIIAKDKSKSENLKSQFDKMGKLLSHYSYYKIESYDGGNFFVGQVGIPFRNYTHVRFDEPSQKGMAFDGMMYGWRGEPLEHPPHLTAPVENIPFEKFDKLKKAPTLINGSFNTILFDRSNDYFCIVNSRMGNRSLFYYEDNQVIAFAPEIKAFLAIDSNKSELDRNGMINFFNYSFLTNGNSLMTGAKRIYPASIIEINKRKMADSYRYWNYKFTNEMDGDIDAYARRFYEKGEDLFYKQIGNEKDCMMALSGGMDSRLLAHYCANSDLNCYYYAHGYKKSLDVKIATEVADVLGVRDRFDVFETDPQNYPKLGRWTTWLVDGMTFLHCSFLNSVIEQYPEDPLKFEFLNSQYSGALNFSYGYSDSKHILKGLSYEEILKRCAMVYGAGYINDEYHSLYAPDVVKDMKESFYKAIEIELKKHLDAHEYFTGIMNKFTLDSKSQRYMNTYDLYRFVYNWHFSLIDDEMFEMFLSTPIKLNSDRSMYKKIFANHAPKLAKIMYEKTGSDLLSPPNEAFLKKKERAAKMRYYLTRLSKGKINIYDPYNYVQINQWYRKYPANRKFFEDILLDKRTFARGYFNESSVRQLLQKQMNGGNYFSVISNLATFELYNRYFIDREEPPVNPMDRWK